MIENCPACGKYTVEKPCYDCIVKERDKYKALVEAQGSFLVHERDKYKRLYQLAVAACPRCQENCAIRSLAGHIKENAV